MDEGAYDVFGFDTGVHGKGATPSLVLECQISTFPLLLLGEHALERYKHGCFRHCIVWFEEFANEQDLRYDVLLRLQLVFQLVWFDELLQWVEIVEFGEIVHHLELLEFVQLQ